MPTYGTNGSVGRREVEKASSHKTIAEYQRDQVKARRSQRRGGMAMGLGTSLAGGALLQGSVIGGSKLADNVALNETKQITNGTRAAYRYTRDTGGGRGQGVKQGAKSGLILARQRPLGAAVVGGGGLVLAGVGNKLRGHSKESRAQYAIDRRREKLYSGRKEEASKGWQPRIARIAPAAGRGGRRIITGDTNGNKIIGKLYSEYRHGPGGKTEYRDDDGNRYFDKTKNHKRQPVPGKQVQQFSIGHTTYGKGVGSFFGGLKQGARNFGTGVGMGLGKVKVPGASSAGKARDYGTQAGLFAGDVGSKVGGSKVFQAVNSNRKLTAYSVGGGAVGGYALAKAHGDSEDARYYRLGAVSGASAAGAGYYGNKFVGTQRRRNARMKSAATQADIHDILTNRPGTDEGVKGLLQGAKNGKAVLLDAKQLKRGGAALGLAGLAVGAGRKASDRRWN